MSNRRKFFYVFCIIIVDVFLIVGFLVIRDATSLNELKNEINELNKLDITKDRYNRKIKSSGGYAQVEEAIKEYLDSYALGIQEISKMVNDSTLSSILSYDNYSSDGPNFDNSLSYLKESKEKFNTLIDQLLNNLEEENIKNYIYDKTEDDYYILLYQELMFDDEMQDDLNEVKDLLTKTKVNLNNVYDVSLEVLNYLKLYRDDWKLEDGEIKFQTKDMYNYYTNLVSKIQTKKDE